jgi:sec-independent protein translocase protein TatC
MDIDPTPTDPPQDPIHDREMPLLDHLAELRKRLLWSALAFLGAFLVSYYFAKDVYYFLAQPLVHIMQERGQKPELIYTALYEAFFTYVKVAVFSAAFISFPVIATQVWLFIAPGLYRSEKRAFLPFLLATPILFFAGGALAYYVIFPNAWRFFLSFQTSPSNHQFSIDVLPKVSDYLNLVMKLIFAFGICFEMPVLLTLLGRVGIITAAGLKKYRRYAYVGCFIVAAILTPPDVFTMTGLAVPLIALFEISIFAVKLVQPKVAPVEP